METVIKGNTILAGMASNMEVACLEEANIFDKLESQQTQNTYQVL